MPLANTQLIGEFQHYFNNFIIGSSLNKNLVPLAVDIPELHFFYKNSFIRLLFSDSWNVNDTSYRYYWLNNDSKISWPTIIRTRLGIYPQSGKYYELTTDSTSGEDIYQLQSDDIVLLDSLLAYRLEYDVTINETQPTISFDSTSNILYANINYLQTNLSKMIFIYLKLKIYDDYSDYDNETILSNPLYTLESAYELYLIDQIFRYVSAKEGLPSTT